MERRYRIGTRTSPLALKQAGEFLCALREANPCLAVEVAGIDTCGDKDRSTPICETEGSDFFTREIDDALLAGDIDIAVHSAKDLPDILKEGLTVGAVTGSIDPYDVLISKSGLRLDELPHGARIGTSSLRRKAQLKAYRNDLETVDIRGNVERRIEELDTGNVDAIVIAAAGLVRLGLDGKITQRLPFDIIRPHPLQGALAVVVRDGDGGLIDILKALDIRKAVLS